MNIITFSAFISICLYYRSIMSLRFRDVSSRLNMEKWLQFTLSTIVYVCLFSKYISPSEKATISSLGEYTSKSLWPHNALALLCEGTLRGQPPNLKVEPGAGDFGCDRQARP